ncbi:unnamed protein product [Dovyalis caffra]|uniref:Ycf15 n=1 Tax=Dovyalis caffra TaxID=77055 RepID=A0AAV1RJ85_9ROSI|nr:unnamed protein product [Dovyalis caffra]
MEVEPKSTTLLCVIRRRVRFYSVVLSNIQLNFILVQDETRGRSLPNENDLPSKWVATRPSALRSIAFLKSGPNTRHHSICVRDRERQQG